MEKKGIGCAIEAEPKTLMGGELVSAREAAKVIIESKGAEEASAIFTAMVSPFEVVQLRFSSGVDGQHGGEQEGTARALME
ncbi:unnamed protein product [Spirodela intermedia]|uniref:Uncharacterized protein n=1 Tax=Spirodela intermedia TaxID=51605 RepID=A0A7I8KYR0_SPIIN|nr:unnamed protein product [Spirodela intermedia]